MSKRIIFTLLGIIFFSSAHLAYAGVEINEIMYDLKTGSDTGREWIEVYNNSDTSVDLSSFRLFEADTNHKLLLAQGDAKVGAQGYALIVSDPAKFKLDWPNFSGIIFDSTFSLNNSGETLAIKDEKLNVVDQYTYSSSLGGAGDGKSLQKINGVWVGAVPTPGQENKIFFVATPTPTPSVKPVVPAKSYKTETSTFVSKTITPTPEINSPINISPTDIPVDLPTAKNNSYLFPIILFIFLGASALAVYFVRRKKSAPVTGEDFEILDE